MRSLFPDAAYFKFLDTTFKDRDEHPAIAAMHLTVEFPSLKTEEAKAVYCDWLARQVSPAHMKSFAGSREASRS